MFVKISIFYRDKSFKNKNGFPLNKTTDKTLVASTKIIITSPSQNNIHIEGDNGNFDSYANGSVTTIFSEYTTTSSRRKSTQVKPLNCPTIVIDSYEDGQIVRNEECTIDFEDGDLKDANHPFDSLFDCEITFESSYNNEDNANSRSNSLSNSFDNAPSLLKRSFCDSNLNLSDTEAFGGETAFYTSTRDSYLSYDSTNNDITDSEAADYFENGVKSRDSTKNGAKLAHICELGGGKTEVLDENGGKLTNTCENGASCSNGGLNDNLPDLLLMHCESPTKNSSTQNGKTTYTNEITVTNSIAAVHAGSSSYGGKVSVVSANGKVKYKLYNG